MSGVCLCCCMVWIATDTEPASRWTIRSCARAEEARRESEQRFRDLVENSLIGISIIQDNRIIYQNRIQSDLLGPLPDTFQIDGFDCLHPDDVEKVKELYQRLLSGETHTVEMDLRLYPPGNKGSKAEPKWAQCRASVINLQGKEAILVNMIDVTRARELENLIVIKNKMVSLGRVAAGMAHEIRNPLTGVNSYLYTLESLCGSEAIEGENIQMMRQIVTPIQSASNKIESVIKRVLDFSKPSVPKMVLLNINQCRT